MVDYAKQVRHTIGIIDALAEKGIYDTEAICFAIIRETGFGERFTKKYLQQAINNGSFSEDDNGTISAKKKVKSNVP
jgi:hypothetical protein